jgi:hypothetical protein
MKGKPKGKPRRWARMLVEGLLPEDVIPVEEARRIAFGMVWNALTGAQAKEVLDELTKTRKFFARDSIPGHATWYPIHLQVEAFIEGLLYPDEREEVEDETA